MPPSRYRASLVSLALIAAATLAPAPLEAQESARLVGTVVDAESGDPVAGASVRLSGFGREATTEPDGRFAFDRLAGGTIVVEVEALGRRKARRTIELAAGRPAEVRIALASRAIEATRIEVLLDRFRVVDPDGAATIAGAAQVLGPEELDRPALLYDDIHAILRQVPGLNVQEEDGYGLRPNIGIRGTGSERSAKVTIMEDGVLATPAPYASPEAYYFPLAGRMEAVEVRKGSSQIKFGPHTTGGAINLVSIPIPDRFGWDLELDGGARGSGKLEAMVGDGGDRLGWLAQTYQLRTDGFKRLDGGGDTGFEIADYLVKLRLGTGGDVGLPQALEVKVGWYDELSHETYLGLTEEDFDADPLRRYAASQRDLMDAEHRTLQLSHTIRAWRGVEIATIAYRNDFRRNWYKLQSVLGAGLGDVLADPEAHPVELAILAGGTSDADALKLRANNREYYAQGVQTIVGAGFEGSGHHALELGIRYHADEEDRFQHEDGYRMSGGRLELTTAGAPGSQSNRVSDARAWALFAADRIQIGRWTLTPGARLESIDFRRIDYPSDDPDRTSSPDRRASHVTAFVPGVGASFAVGPNLHLFGGLHEGFGPPGPGADDETEPEQSLNFELGARWSRPGSSAQLVGFVNDYDNVLGRRTLATGDPTGAGEVFNGGQASVHGVELALDVDLDRWAGVGLGLPLGVAYTYTRATFDTSFESEFEPWGSVEAGDELPYVPDHQLHASLGVDGDRWRARLATTHVGAMRTEAGRGPIPAGSGTDAATVWSVSGEIAITPSSRAFVGVQNLTDESYVVARRPAGARPGLPRTVSAGVRIGR